MSKSESAPVRLVAQSSLPFDEEESALLGLRLRAITFLLTTALCLVLARDLAFGTGPTWQFQAAAIVAMVSLALLLSAKHAGSSLWLRTAEVSAIGLMSVVVAAHLWHKQLAATASGDATALLGASKDTVIGTTILLFAYALLVPAPRGRAWKTIAAIVAFPLAAELLLFLVHPEVFRLARQVATFQRIGEGIFLLTMVALLAGYGAHLASTMRIKARDARQFNQYRLRDQIGAGGMGEVYLAEHRLLKRPCVIKVIRPERSKDPLALERFEHEVRATAGLSAPNIVEVFDYGRTEDGTFFYVMEHLHGMSLEELVAAHGALPPGRAIYLLRQACEALAEAHAVGLIHRDLKPANIFAARRGRRYDFVKLLDFGLVVPVPSRHQSSPGREEKAIGSPQYMAPEQITGDRPPDRTCDLYGLGGVAYTLLTGRPPFDGETVAQVLDAQVNDPVLPPSRHRPDIPRDLEEIVLRCLAKDPSDRYQSVEELDLSLGACVSSGDWDAQKAADWWTTFEPSKVALSAPV
jgi:eukaryotic-like serine/threonine-protein kinase